MEELNYVQEAKSIFKNCIEPKLKGEGFKKNGNIFYRPRSEFIDICNVQFGRANTRDFACFTYNIKIAMPSFYEKFDVNYDKKIDCLIIDHRLGTIMGFLNNTVMIDYWYKVGTVYELDYEENLVRNAIMNHETPKRIEELRAIGRYSNLLNNRYDRKNLEDARRTITMDLDNIVVSFFNKIQNVDDLAELITNVNVNGGFEMLFLLVYFVERGEIAKGIQYVKNIYKNNFFKERIDKYLKSKGLCMS